MIFAYVKKRLSPRDLDNMRIDLSVQEKKLSPEPHCDFCGDPHPVFVYAASQTTAGEDVKCWRWAACQDCSNLIDTETFEGVEEKIAQWLVKKLDLTDMDRTFFRAIAKNAMRTFHRYSIRILRS
jgi:hypothetical protein